MFSLLVIYFPLGCPSSGIRVRTRPPAQCSISDSDPTNSPNSESRLDFAHAYHPSFIFKMASKIQHVVADAGAFIRNAPLRDIGEKVYTVPEVIAESCDKATRQRLKTLPVELTFKEPSSEAVLFVTSFSKKTGDYGSLSAVDLKVLALTYDLERQFNGTNHIRKEPLKKPEYTVGSSTPGVDQVISSKRYGEGDALPSHLIEDDSEEDEDDDEVQDDNEDDDGDKDNEHVDGGALAEEMDAADDVDEEEEEEEEDEDDEGWITPSNINDVKRSYGVETVKAGSLVSVGCLTTDFAMQNVLIQMGLHVLSVDGMLIKQVKSYVLRCHGCMRITKDTSKQFCPHCGNKTLKRLTTSIDENGVVKYHLARNYMVRTRGKKYSLPKPQGGKHAFNPLLTADQPLPHQRPAKKALQKVDILSADYVADSSPFRLNDVTSRASQLGRNKQQAPQWTRRNPNENRRKPNKRK
ncbi:RNA-binding protein NOB1 [Aplysia californica]|uniref:RNA-binding protein NOB1 n=1 Tax=Aplysia californica TaxID=6500 RepID=A0ABM0JGN2_APLCA|nr:RNA-binding protein NOB1 [Aplysia californica]